MLHEYLMAAIPFLLAALFVLVIRQNKEQKCFVRELNDEGFTHIFHGSGINFIAFNIENGLFRFGKLGRGSVERPISFINNYEWKWEEKNARKTSNKYLFYISDTDHFMHEVFYSDKERQAEVDWARLDAVYHQSLSCQYQIINDMERSDDYDFFISHASEDKDEFVRPLAKSLSDAGMKVWYDEFTLEVGDSLRRALDQGLGRSRYGIVVLSHAFFSKHWTQYEMDALVNRSIHEEKVILPIWYGVEHKDVSRYSHSLADKIAFSSTALSIDDMVKEFLRLVQRNG